MTFVLIIFAYKFKNISLSLSFTSVVVSISPSVVFQEHQDKERCSNITFWIRHELLVYNFMGISFLVYIYFSVVNIFLKNRQVEPFDDISLQWRQTERDGVANHRRRDCLLNILFRRRSKKASKLRVTVLCEGKPPVVSPHKGPITRKSVSI